MLEVDVLQRDYSNLFRRLTPLEERLVVTIEERDNMARRMDEEEVLLEEHRNEENDIEHRLDERRHEFSGLVARINDTRQQLLVNEERERSLLQRAARLKEDKQNYDVRIGEIEARKEALTHNSKAARRAGTARPVKAAPFARPIAIIEEQVSQKKLQSENRQQRRMQLMQKSSQQNNEVERLDARTVTIEN